MVRVILIIFLENSKFFSFNNIAGDVKIKWIWGALFGIAKEWIQVTLNPTPPTSYTEIKDALLLAIPDDAL